jgi:glutamate dehydrogenase/leucine dehydrogenase
MDHHEFYREIHNHSIALFIPAAGSYWVDEKLAQLLIQCRCQLIVSGANIPFKNAQVLKNLKQHMRVVESYMSSGGMACALSVLLNHKHAIQTPEEVLHAIDGVACGLELY